MWISGRHVLPTGLWALLFSLAQPALSQVVTTMASNASSDLLPVATSPRYLLNGSEIASLPSVQLAPLTDAVAGLTQQQFSVSLHQSYLLRSELT
jgi:hypothetical protein